MFNLGCDQQVINIINIDENLNINEVVLMVVGNKIDLTERRRVPTDRATSEYTDKFDI